MKASACPIPSISRYLAESGIVAGVKADHTLYETVSDKSMRFVGEKPPPAAGVVATGFPSASPAHICL